MLWQEEPDQRFHVDHFTPLLYAAASLPLLWSYATSINRRLQIAFHLADIAFAVAMLFAAEHAVVLFVMLSTFCLLSAAAQWRWSTVVATGLCLLSCYGASVFAGLIGDERLFIRTLFLALATCLLAWATQAREAQRGKLLRLAAWDTGRLDGSSAAMGNLLRHAASFIGADSILVIWHENEGEWREALFSDRAGSVEIRIKPCGHGPTPPEALRRRAYLVPAGMQIAVTSRGVIKGLDTVPPKFLAFVGPGNDIASAPFSGSLCEGRIFAAGRGPWRLDTAVLLELLGVQILSRLEGHALRQKQAQIAAQTERARWSRDLHDGLLQSITATRLRLHLADNAQDIAETKVQIAAAASLLQDEQRRLREAVEMGQLFDPLRTEFLGSLGAVMRKSAEHWNLSLEIDIMNGAFALPHRLYLELSLIVSEVIANAARHGDGALHARIRMEAKVIHMDFNNPLKAGAQAEAQECVRPRSLSWRTASLGGAMSFVTTADQARLHLEIPAGE